MLVLILLDQRPESSRTAPSLHLPNPAGSEVFPGGKEWAGGGRSWAGDGWAGSRAGLGKGLGPGLAVQPNPRAHP